VPNGVNGRPPVLSQLDVIKEQRKSDIREAELVMTGEVAPTEKTVPV
jgi:hypothetical protein